MTSTEFADDFNRADSGTVGEGWAETEPSGSTCAISSNTCVLTYVGASPTIEKTGSISDTTPTRLDYLIKGSDISTGIKEVGIYLKSGSSNVMLISILQNKLRYYDAGWQDVTGGGGLSDDTYYLISLRNIDYTADTFDIWLDDVQKMTGVPFETAVSSIDTIHCRADGGAIVFTIDYISEGPFTTGTNTQINIGDVWKEVPAMQINIGDTWKAVASAQINIGDTWKSVF